MSNMLIRDKKLSSLSLVRDEFGNYIGCYNSDNNSIRKFENPEHNLYNIFKNFEAYFPDWEDQGFGIYVNNKNLSLMIKDKFAHEMNADVVIKDNSMKMYPEVRNEFIRYCRKRLDNMKYLHVQINEGNKEHHFSIDKYGNFVRICDVKGFLAKYPYFPDLSYVPKTFYRELDLVTKSIERRQDVGLNFCLKLATDMTDEDILKFQDVFREKTGKFIFDKSNRENVLCLIDYLKEKSPGNKHFNVINLLYSTHGYEYRELDSNPNSYCIKYTHGMKKELLNLIVEDKDCVSVINTNIIPKEYRNNMIKKDEDLIKELRFMYHEDIDVEYLKNYINRDISNLKYINVVALLKKDFEYGCEILDKYLQQNINIDDSIIDKILLKYSNCIKETTIKKCIDSFNLINLYILSKIKNAAKYVPCFINRINGEIIEKTDKEIRKSINKLMHLFEDKYEIEYAEKDSSLVIAIKDKETDGYIIELNEPTLSNEIMHLNQEEISNYSWGEAVASNTLKDEDDNNTFAEAYSRQLDMIFG